MKQIKRLGASADLQNNDAGYITLTLRDFDGGPFGLHPYITDDAVILPDARRPSYGVAITGSPEVLDRFGKALLTVARNARNGGDDTGDDADL